MRFTSWTPFSQRKTHI